MTPTKKKKKSLKQWVRGVFNKGTSDTKANKKSKKEQNTMADEVKKDETKKTNETVETKKDGKEETVVEKKDATTEVDETKKTDEEPRTEENTEEPAEPTVADTPESGNGMLVEELVTKEEMHEMFAGLNAKIDALLKENQDLKDENAKLREKYEDNGDFGTSVMQGVQAKSGKYAESFEEYSKPYMK